MGSLSLLQWIFSTLELNWGLLHCRWILFQLSYEGSPGLVVSPKVKVKVKSLSRVRLCDPMDCNLPGSSLHGILQARVVVKQGGSTCGQQAGAAGFWMAAWLAAGHGFYTVRYLFRCKCNLS